MLDMCQEKGKSRSSIDAEYWPLQTWRASIPGDLHRFHRLRQGQRKKYCCTILDSFTKFFIAKPVPGARAIDAARTIVEKVVLRHQVIPSIVSSDRGTAFVSATMKELYEQLGMEAEYHTAYRPQGTGNLERQHRTFNSMIFMLQHERGMTWIDAAPYAVAFMNSHRNSSTGQAPHTLVTGRRSRLTIQATIHDKDVSSDSPAKYGSIIKERLELLHDVAKIANKNADLEMEKKLDKAHRARPLHKGDQVTLYRPVSKAAKKNGYDWLGPFTVITASEKVVKIKDNKQNVEWVHRAHLRYVPDRFAHLRNSELQRELKLLEVSCDPLISPENRPENASGSYPEDGDDLPKVGRPAKESSNSGSSKKSPGLTSKQARIQPTSTNPTSKPCSAASTSLPSVSTSPSSSSSLPAASTTIVPDKNLVDLFSEIERRQMRKSSRHRKRTENSM